jgi:hypothetical protein
VHHPEKRFVNASEVGTYLFCKRAWRFQQQGAPSAREPERAAGTAYHIQHGKRVAAGERAGRLVSALLLVAIVLLLLGLLGLVL